MKKPQIPAGQRTIFILSMMLAVLAILSMLLSYRVLEQQTNGASLLTLLGIGN